MGTVQISLSDWEAGRDWTLPRGRGWCVSQGGCALLSIFENVSGLTPRISAIMKPMVTRYLQEAMRRAQFKNLENGSCFGEIPGLAGVWANEPTLTQCRLVLQEVLEEWLVLKIRDGDPIPRIGRVRLTVQAA